MQLLNSKILSNDKNTRYSNKKAQDTRVTCAFLSVVAFSYYKDGGDAGFVANIVCVITEQRRTQCFLNRIVASDNAHSFACVLLFPTGTQYPAGSPEYRISDRLRSTICCKQQCYAFVRQIAINPRIDDIEKQVEQEVQLVSRLCANTYFDTICVHPIKSAYTLSKFAYSLLKMRTVKCTDKLKFMVAKQILDWGTQILLSTRLPEIQIFCTAPLVQSLFHHFHEMLIP